MSNQALLDKLDRTTEVLSQALSHLVKLSSIDQSKLESSELGKGEGSEHSIATIATTGVMIVHLNTFQLIKGVQDLLVITRSIREKWVLEHISDEDTNRERRIDYEKCEDLLNKALETIFNNAS